MIQYSVYGRLLNGKDAQAKHFKRLINHLPARGIDSMSYDNREAICEHEAACGYAAFSGKSRHIRANAAFLVVLKKSQPRRPMPSGASRQV